MKVLAILQMLAFLDRSCPLCRYLFQLSQSSSPQLRDNAKSGKFDSSWPFMCVSIMFTKEALQSLRRVDLNIACNKAKNVLSVLHAFHHGCFIDFAKRLQSQPTVHHAVLLAAVREKCSKSPSQILDLFNDLEISRLIAKSEQPAESRTLANDLDLHDLSKIDDVQQPESLPTASVNLTAKASRFAVN